MSQADDVFIRQFGVVLGLLVLFAIISYLIAKAVGAASHEQVVAGPRATLERIAPIGRVVLAESESAAAPAATPTVPGEPAAPADPSTVQVEPATPSAVPTAEASAAATAPAADTAPASATPPAASPALAAAASAPTAAAQQAAAPPATAPAAEATAAAAPAYNGQEIYQGVCFACHITGAAGAPKLTDTAAWSERATRGVQALTATVITGKGAMPPRGGRPDVDDGALEAAVRYMLEEAGVPAN